jgi:hypothetical protein
MNMTPEQKLKFAIIERAREMELTEDASEITEENVDELFDSLDEGGELQDAISEVRCSGEDTGLECERSRHYESKAVAAKMPDGSWVGWTYWYGGGKHGEPEAVDWMSDAYALSVSEEQKRVTVKTFTREQQGSKQ